ncbi:MAG: hypothetical protein AB7O96_07090 [Pseudobdellovibrionaceae bacterium]
MRFGIFAIFLICLIPGMASADYICELHPDWCERSGSSRRASMRPTSPSTGSSVNINPSAVPVEKGFGIETIGYKSDFDFSVVRGLGRIGAAISPSNSEETFFGPPGFELEGELLARKIARDKFKSSKLNLATAFNLWTNKKKGLSRVEVNLGLMAKYNGDTKQTKPGGGLSGVLGPITFGLSKYFDQHRFELNPEIPEDDVILNYEVETYSGGIFLNTVAVDYSVLKLRAIQEPRQDPAVVTLATLSVFFKQGIVTLSKRVENSDRRAYNFKTHLLEEIEKKTEYFGGLQLHLSDHLMLGFFYNYYLLHEGSVGVTLFF